MESKESALRIQRIVRKTKADDAKLKLDTVENEKPEEEPVFTENQKTSSITDSSLEYEKLKLEEFNSELDLYSEIDSAYFRKPRRGTVILKHPVAM